VSPSGPRRPEVRSHLPLGRPAVVDFRCRSLQSGGLAPQRAPGLYTVYDKRLCLEYPGGPQYRIDDRLPAWSVPSCRGWAHRVAAVAPGAAGAGVDVQAVCTRCYVTAPRGDPPSPIPLSSSSSPPPRCRTADTRLSGFRSLVTRPSSIHLFSLLTRPEWTPGVVSNRILPEDATGPDPLSSMEIARVGESGTDAHVDLLEGTDPPLLDCGTPTACASWHGVSVRQTG
jgi:hypothetical protein